MKNNTGSLDKKKHECAVKRRQIIRNMCKLWKWLLVLIPAHASIKLEITNNMRSDVLWECIRFPTAHCTHSLVRHDSVSSVRHTWHTKTNSYIGRCPIHNTCVKLYQNMIVVTECRDRIKKIIYCGVCGLTCMLYTIAPTT